MHKHFLMYAGCWVGFLGIWLSILAGIVDHAEGDLAVWPSTLSELNSEHSRAPLSYCFSLGVCCIRLVIPCMTADPR